MFEVDDSQVGADKRTLPAAFRKLGYHTYRLIGPDLMLVPVRADEKTEEFELNLFACKLDRAESLAAAGLLVAQPSSTIRDGDGLAFYNRQIYAAAFGALAFSDSTYRRALDAYAVWRDETAPPILRWAALSEALAAAQEAAHKTPSVARLSTLARFAFEAGQRRLAIDTLQRAIMLFESGTKPPEEPFFPAARRYETVDPGNFAEDWFVAATIEAWEQWRSFSGCFVPAEVQRPALLNWLLSTPFASAPMERRRQLQRWRAELQSRLQAAPILSQAAPDNLNPALWMAGRAS
jgi:hypothetical protein